MNHVSLEEDLIKALDTAERNPEASQLLAEKAILRSQRNGWLRSLALANLLSGWSQFFMGMHDQAMEAFVRADSLLTDIGVQELQYSPSFGLGLVNMNQGDYALAIDQFRRSLTLIEHPTAEVEAPVRLNLARALMNVGYWTEAERELLSFLPSDDFDGTRRALYELLILRLKFYRGDRSSVQEQLHVCRDLIFNLEHVHAIVKSQIEFYEARYVAKYVNTKTGDTEFRKIWQRTSPDNPDVLYLLSEAAYDLLASDYPKKGVEWLTMVIGSPNAVEPLKRQVHLALAQFYRSHRSFEVAIEHFEQANECLTKIRLNEFNRQWARYQAAETQHLLKYQIDQHKKSNKILAESNAILQAVNRIAMSVNAAMNLVTLQKNLKTQLSGWVDVDLIAFAEIANGRFNIESLLYDERIHPDFVVDASIEQLYAHEAMVNGRIVVDNACLNSVRNFPEPIFQTLQSAVFIPLKNEKDVFGILTLQSGQENLFTPRMLSLLEYIAPVVTIAFANIKQSERSQRLSGVLDKQERELADVRELMSYISDHDAVTGLPNRNVMLSQFPRWAETGSFACLLMKINNLDSLNSKLGFGLDEEALKIFAQRMKNRVRENDLLLQIAHDQFLMLVEMTSVTSIYEIAKQIIELGEKPFRAKDDTLSLDLSVGVVCFPQHGETVEELMSMAAVALNYATTDESSIFMID